jgi:hypothetical protein
MAGAAVEASCGFRGDARQASMQGWRVLMAGFRCELIADIGLGCIRYVQLKMG